ncbi:antitoxin [Pseudonocardia kujensis]|uniref:antitoxin n=1 Tax=Pseudonocardia kujensis TaxID=1128675 RepID=UPI0027E1AAE5|nr:antitoxin [Pseudonocardia kujensis]
MDDTGHDGRKCMAGMIRKLGVLAGAAEAARRYARKNPEQAGKFLDQAAQFVDKQTKGKYSGQIQGVAQKAKGVAGIQDRNQGYGHPGRPTDRQGPGQQGYGQEPPTAPYRGA